MPNADGVPITNVPDPVNAQDAATKNYVDHDPAVLIALWQGGFS